MTEQAAIALFNRLKDPITKALTKLLRNRDDADDVVQVAFARLLENADRIDTTKNPESWLWSVAFNAGRDMVRYNRRRPAGRFIEEADVPAPESEQIQAEDKEQVHRCIDSLPAMFREVIKLHYFEDMSYDKLAERLGVPLGTMKSRLYTARKLFQEEWTRVSAA